MVGLREQAALLRDGEVSSEELVGDALRRIEEGRGLGAFRVVRDGALAEARVADKRLKDGERPPLLGVPIAIKDDTDIAGETTPFAVGGRHPVAAKDSEVVRRLRAAGAVVVGKTTTCEIGLWPFSESSTGCARNPWDVRYSPGGSSGGSAAAVAAGMVAAAVGSDGAGSIRIPSAWTGLVGIKPQRGRVSGYPHADPFYGLTVHGPLARSVGDAALLLDVLSGSHPEDVHRLDAPVSSFAEAAQVEPRRLRVTVSFATASGSGGGRLDPQIRAAVERLARRLTALGHKVFPADPDYGYIGLGLVPRGTAGVADWVDTMPEGEFEPRTLVEARLGRVVGRRMLPLSKRLEPRFRQRVGRIFRYADVVLTPTTAWLPLKVGALDGAGWRKTQAKAAAACPYAWPWNVLGWPGVNVPAGLSEEGLPIGAQLLGHDSDEATLISLAAQLEAVEKWTERRPEVRSR